MKISVLKPVLKWFLPFFKDNKTLTLIKTDMQSVGEEFLARTYDATKKLFFIDEERKSIFEQWQQSIEKEETPKKIAELVVKGTIEENLQSETNYKKEISEILKEIEAKYPKQIEMHNSISGTLTDAQIAQGINESTVIQNKGQKS